MIRLDLFNQCKIGYFMPNFRHDSTITAPYSKWVYYNSEIKQQNQHKNYAANKTKKIAWIVSNCFAKNARYSYAKELQKYIQV